MKLSERAFAPTRATRGSSGIDVFSPVDVTVQPFQDQLIPLDLRFEIPLGYDLVVENRSSVATKKKLFRGAGLIDGDYRGNVHIHLINVSTVPAIIERGDKIAQLVLREVIICDLEEGEVNVNTERGELGFGSTDKGEN
jgi:dUTP pyrophosphatase